MIISAYTITYHAVAKQDTMGDFTF